jgi:two-component system chemotaxis response regulator CheY
LSGGRKALGGWAFMNTVLIVDDSLFMRMFIRRIIEKEGYLVIGEAEDGVECIEKFKKYRPQVVTLDVTMPRMNGIHTLSALMEIDPVAKIIMISSLGQESVVKQAISIGASTFIVKPFKNGQIISAVNKMILRGA